MEHSKGGDAAAAADVVAGCVETPGSSFSHAPQAMEELHNPTLPLNAGQNEAAKAQAKRRTRTLAPDVSSALNISNNTWIPKVCRIMAFWATFRGFGPLFYLLWGFRYAPGTS